MRRLTAAGIAGAAVASLTVLAPVAANASGNSGTTNVTFSLTGGSLTISTPASAALTSGGGLSLGVGGGQSVSGALGTTTVDDAQGALTHTDSVTMAVSDFTDAAGDTISAANATGYSGAAIPDGSLGVAVPVPTLTGVNVGGAGGQILQLTGVVGTAGVQYSPTVTVPIPADAVAGDYSGTVTQTVS